ncbi:MAG: autotransporter-associated beta strand repeat-containing protein, partial [Desulfuromonadales bacterium]|nr:autotransporter-associated beta strand repeat-containing protein [Desulfuromonadales bacterium]
MNKVFKTIWNEVSGAWVAVAEITKGHGKGRRGKLVVAAILAAALGLSFSSAAYAQTVTTDNDVTVAGIAVAPGTQTSPWNPVNLVVGNTGNGTLAISDGGVVSATTSSPGVYTYIGLSSGGNGVVTVSGSGSQWNNSAPLVVGKSGAGTLEITDGGSVSNSSSYIGYDTGSNGAATVSGASTWTNSGILYVGYNGMGTLDITGGGTVTANQGVVGAYSTGTANVDGDGSSWTISSSLSVGTYHGGDGTLNITNGGKVSSNYSGLAFVIGDGTDSPHDAKGTVNVDGYGSTLDVTGGTAAVGQYGTGTLNITNGGTVSIATLGSYVGLFQGSNGTISVDGPDSKLDISTWIIVGYQGTAQMSITNGGTVSNDSGYIANQAGSISTVTVDGVGSTWINDGGLYIGSGGTGILTIKNGGLVTATSFEWSGAAGGTGIINIGAAQGDSAEVPGTLDTPIVQLGTDNSLMVFNHTDNTGSYFFNPQIVGPGAVLHEAGITTFTALGSDPGSVDVTGGTLAFAQAGDFSTIGNYTTESGATTALITAPAALNVGGEFTQASGSNLNVVLGNGMLPNTNSGFAPDITAVSASLAGNLTVTNFDDSTLPTIISSNTLIPVYNLIHTTGSATDGITGNFDSVSPITTNGAQALPDYLVLGSGLSNNNNDYDIGYQLAWFSGATIGNGIFTVNPYNGGESTFEVDVPLTNQSASATGWDGTSLTKNGTGTLILGAANTYTGATTINSGTLQAGTADTITDSGQVTVNAAGTLDLNNYDQQINKLTGTGTVTNTGATLITLTENNATASDSTTFDGTITGPTALTKVGAGTLTLTGANSYTGA